MKDSKSLFLGQQGHTSHWAVIVELHMARMRSHQSEYSRVWKGIFGIRDLTKIRCGNREKDKYIDGIRDLTVSREAGLAKNWARDAGFMFACLSGMPETIIYRF